MNSRTAAKIEALTALVNHAKTGADERDAAKRALLRIHAAQAETARDDIDYQRFHSAGHWQGSKYEQARRLDLAEIAKLMREDIKISRKVGKSAPGATDLAVLDPIADAPAQIKVSIRSRYFSGGGAIDIVIRNVSAEWGWTEGEIDNGYSDGRVHKIATPAFAAYKAAIDEIHSAYNYDNSDAQVDYFDRHYWGSVDTEECVHFPRPWEYAA
jgi:hypothetical protein